MKKLLVTLLLVTLLLIGCSEEEEKIELAGAVSNMANSTQKINNTPEKDLLKNTKSAVFSMPFITGDIRNLVPFEEYCGTWEINLSDNTGWQHVSETPADSVLGNISYNYRGEQQTAQVIFYDYSENNGEASLNCILAGGDQGTITVSLLAYPEISGNGEFSDFIFDFTYSSAQTVINLEDIDDDETYHIVISGDVMEENSLPQEVTVDYANLSFKFDNIKFPPGYEHWEGAPEYEDGEGMGILELNDEEIGDMVFEGNADDWKIIVYYNDGEEYEIPPSVIEEWFVNFLYN